VAALHSANVSHTAMRAVYPYVYTQNWYSATQLHLQSAVYQAGGVILARSLRRRTIELQMA